MKKTHIFFLDPGLPLKIDVLESPAHFFARVRMEKAYTCAELHFEGVRVWGGDDTGMELDTDEGRARWVFSRIVDLTTVADLKALGLKPA